MHGYRPLPAAAATLSQRTYILSPNELGGSRLGFQIPEIVAAIVEGLRLTELTAANSKHMRDMTADCAVSTIRLALRFLGDLRSRA